MDHVLRDLSAIASQPYIALIILAALAFDFVNGFHDAANSIATIVGTRVLKPIFYSFASDFCRNVRFS